MAMKDAINRFELAQKDLEQAIIKEIKEQHNGLCRFNTENEFTRCMCVFINESYDTIEERTITAVAVFGNELCILCEDIDGMSDEEIEENSCWETLHESGAIYVLALQQISISLLNI